jgi:holo-[acyl-carrier protein] synthase
VGVDLVDVRDIEESILRFGSRFTTRVFAPEELRYAESSESECAARLAARFAAKEAVMKLLRVGDQALPWRSIEIRRSPAGDCDVELSGEALRVAQALGVGRISVSLTHHGTMAAAVAAALAGPDEGS